MSVNSLEQSQADRERRPGHSTAIIETRGAAQPLEDQGQEAVQRTCRWLYRHQQADGYWCGELQGDTILESEYILLLAWLGLERSAVAVKAARYILTQQQAHGGWAQYPGGELDISVSVKAYFALKLTGHDPQSDYMHRARHAILQNGGADAVNSFTRYYLALLGQISYDCCPAVPPELTLFPAWLPINMYRISAWSRTIFVPLSIIWAYRPVRQLPVRFGITELFLQEPADWPPLRAPGLPVERGWLNWERFFRGVDSGLKRCERWRIRPLRKRALKNAARWMLARFEDSDGLGAIFPPIVWSVVALKCLGYDDASREVRYCLSQLDDLMVEEGEGSEATIRLEPCKSPVWDTALALRSLATAKAAGNDPWTSRSVRWLLNKQVTRPGDWANNVAVEPGGWFFEYRNAFYPDVDDTAMVLTALREVRGDDSEVVQACSRATDWVLAMQNRDGGWGAFDKDNDAEFLCHVPFADHNAMIDPSSPDLTGRVLEALGQWGRTIEDPAVRRAIAYLRETQEADGGWFGRWGVNYVYGTWQVLVGLRQVGVAVTDPAIVRGANWLLTHQYPNGGWGESPHSYLHPGWRGRGPTTASQTAWAILGLIAAGLEEHPSVRKGVRYLIERQREDGSWEETEFTGTGFPRVFYLRYHMYPIYFPLQALAKYFRGKCESRPE